MTDIGYFWQVNFIYAPELFPTQARARGFALVNTVGSIGFMFSPLITTIFVSPPCIYSSPFYALWCQSFLMSISTPVLCSYLVRFWQSASYNVGMNHLLHYATFICFLFPTTYNQTAHQYLILIKIKSDHMCDLWLLDGGPESEARRNELQGPRSHLA